MRGNALDTTTQGKDHRAFVGRPLNLQRHRISPCDHLVPRIQCKASANRKLLKMRGLMTGTSRELREFAKFFVKSEGEGGRASRQAPGCAGAGSAAPVATNSPIDGLWGQLEADASRNGMQRDEKYENE